MAENIVVYNVRVDVENGKIAIDGLTKGFVKAETAVKRLNKTMQETTTKGLNPMIDKSGLAGAAVVEIGRTISDSNYGIRGMANNLSQLATLLTTLIVTTKGAKNAWDALMKSFRGPLGIIVIFQIAIALLEKFAINNEKSSKASQDAASKLRSQSEVLRLLNEELRSSNLTMEKREKILNTLVHLDKDLSKALEFYNGNLEKQSQLLEQLERLKNKEADATDAQKAANERLTIIDEQLNEKRAFANRLSISSTSSTRQYLAVTDEVAALEKEQTKIKEDLINAQSELTKEQKAYSAEIKAVNDEIARRNKLEALLIKWNETRLESETNSELELLKLKEKFAIKEAKDLGATKEQLLDIEAVFRNKRYKLKDEEYEELLKLQQEYFNEELDLIEENNKQIDELLKSITAKRKEEDPIRFSDYDFDDLDVDIQIDELLKKNKEKEEARIKGLNDTIAVAQAVGAVVSGIADNIDAAYQKELDVEQNKTNVLNNQLRERLANEQLSADERKNIQGQIAKNDEALRLKQEAIEKKRFKANKAAAIAEATISTFLAATGVLKDTKGGSVARIAGMIAVIGSGLAQVAMIAKQQFVSSQSSIGAGAAASGAGTSGVQAPDFNVVGQSSSNQIASVIQSQMQKPIRTYVVSKDVSSAQEMDRNIVTTASLG